VEAGVQQQVFLFKDILRFLFMSHNKGGQELTGIDYLIQIIGLAIGTSAAISGLIAILSYRREQKLEPILRDGIKIGMSQLRLHPKRLGEEWREVLEEVVGNIT